MDQFVSFIRVISLNNNKNNIDYLIANPKEREFTANLIKDDKLPLVSFCIPTKNNENTIENCLQSIVNQNYTNFEIIIIDGYSSDKTLSIAQKYTNKIFYESGKLGAARQKSINYSDGEIVALFDSDIVIPHRNWLTNAVKFFNYNNKVSTIWPMNIALPNSPYTQRLYFNLWRLFIENRIKNGKGFFGGGNSLFLKKSLDDIGEMDNDIHWGEDFDLAKKLKDKGYSVVYISDPLYHDTMRTFKEFFSKQFTGARTFTDYGFGLMGLSTKDIAYEHFVIGFSAMMRGLLFERDFSWSYYPFLLFARLYAYLLTPFLKYSPRNEVI